jgi:molybdopterin-guanine dinucleotide biosynthesis protein A/molybdopterin converting factor small subunit
MIHFEGATLLEKLVYQVKKIASEVIVVSNDTKHHKYETIEVREQNAIGPLNGLLNGLKHCNTDWVFVLSVDMPFLDLDKLVDNLKTEINKGFKIVIPSLGDREQYLSGFYHKNILPIIEELIATEQYSMRSLIEKLSDSVVSVNCENNFTNINSFEDVTQTNLKLVNVITFGMIQESLKFGKADMLTKATTIGEFKTELAVNYPKIKDSSFSIALNQDIVLSKSKINNNDEIALLPPFAGG